MAYKWDQARLELLIKDEIEEDHQLEYKAAESLGKSDGKKKEITKDVSSMANSSGGILIYGIEEYSAEEKRHLPERIDPINRSEFSREWLDQIVGNIEPRIDDLIIHSISLDSDTSNVAYVLEIPKGETAHQAKDYRYYRRYNFEAVPMRDSEIRDVMNRSELPQAEVEISYKQGSISADVHDYRLNVVVRNIGFLMIRDFKLQITFPNYGRKISFRTVNRNKFTNYGYITGSQDDNGNDVISFISGQVLFPQDEFNLGPYLNLNYSIDEEAYKQIRMFEKEDQLNVAWALFADNMLPKRGKVPFSTLHNY